MKTLLICTVCLYLILYIVFAIKSGNIKKSITQSVLVGVSTLVLIHLIGGYLEFSVPLNIYTIIFSALTGLPGVILVTLIGFIIV